MGKNQEGLSNGGAMKTSCEECEAIVLEYKRACLDFWLNANEETREGCRAIGQLISGGSEADVARAEELLRPFKPATFEPKMNEPTTFLEAYVGSAFDQVRGESVGKRSSRISEVAYRKLQHQFKSGHYVSFRLSLPSDSSAS
jgi:hypothetical protein